MENEALLIVSDAAPVFETVTLSVLLVPAVTLPKSRLALLKAKIPDCCGWPELTPWQPIMVARERRSSPSLIALRGLAVQVVE